MTPELPFRLLTPDGRWAIEVTQQEDGQFRVLVILDAKTTVESLVTADSEKVISSATRQMKEVLRRQKNEAKEEELGSPPVDPV